MIGGSPGFCTSANFTVFLVSFSFSNVVDFDFWFIFCFLLLNAASPRRLDRKGLQKFLSFVEANEGLRLTWQNSQVVAKRPPVRVP